MPAEPTSSRLQRLLTLVPWVLAHADPSVDEVCSRFGISRSELTADIAVLFQCGLPPFGPGDLIEAFIEEDRVVIRFADWLARPMRLSRYEALALLVMGRAISRLPGLEEAHSLASALGKLERALAPAEARPAADLAERVAVELDDSAADLLGELRDAISGRERVDLVYHSYGRDETTERRIDPLLVFPKLGHWYLAAHDHLSGEERLFRVDRIRSMARTGERFSPPEGFDAERVAAGPLFTPSPDDREVTLDLAPAARWVMESVYYDSAEEMPGGWTRVVLRTPHLPWLVRLLLALGDEARPVSPPDLAAGVAAEARAALARYAGERLP